MRTQVPVLSLAVADAVASAVVVVVASSAKADW